MDTFFVDIIFADRRKSQPQYPKITMNFRFWTLLFWKDIGYGLGSSRYLAERLVSLANLQDANVILELGAGSGQVTRYILKAKGSHAKFISIENDHEKFELLKDHYGKNCELHEMSAAHLEQVVEPGTVDVIISTLPLGSISDEGVQNILKSAHSSLKSGGVFIQYQYWMYNRKDVQKYFTIEKTYWEPRNIGPAFIYKAYKK